MKVKKRTYTKGEKISLVGVVLIVLSALYFTVFFLQGKDVEDISRFSIGLAALPFAIFLLGVLVEGVRGMLEDLHNRDKTKTNRQSIEKNKKINNGKK